MLVRSHIFSYLYGEKWDTECIKDTGVLLLHQWSTLKKNKKLSQDVRFSFKKMIVWTIPNPTPQQNAEIHPYLSDTSYQKHENIIFYILYLLSAYMVER